MTEDLSVQCLVRRLCDSIASNAYLDPRLASRLSSQLFDTAFTSLIGLADPGLDIPYVAPEARAAVAAAGLDQACSNLAATSYSELAASLSHLAEALHRLDTVAVLGTKVQELSGAPLALPLTEQDALLSFLLGLQGSQLSVRRRQVTRQVTHEAPNVAAPLGFSVFNEMPDPYALTNVSSTRALLPSELGYPTHPFAGARDVKDLSAGMSSRPAWNPTATAYAPKPPSTAWLPVAGPLVEMHSDRRKGQQPPPLGLPWSLLSMGLPPGANTTFQALLEPDENDGSSAFGAAPNPFGRSVAAASGSEGADGVALEVGSSNRLWNLEEADLARDAMLALQGVHSALMRLQGALAVPKALPRLSLAGLLARVAAAAELRQRLQLFVDLHLSSPTQAAGAGVAGNRPLASGSSAAGMHTPGGLGGRRGSSGPSTAAAAATAASGHGTDPVLRAFAAAVGEVLRRQAAALQALQREGAVAWVRSVQVGGQAGRQLHGRGLTPLQVAIHTGRLQSQLQSLAALCWCLPHQQDTEADEVQKAAGPQASGRAAPISPQQWDSYPRGAALLSFLYQALVEADDSELPTHRFLFTSALAPYLSHLRSWAFTSAPLAPEFATWAEESVAPCLDFEPPEVRSAAEARQLPSRLAVPCDPPSFLRPLHAAFMRAGTQLRLLASMPQQGRELVSQLASIAEQESKGLLLGQPTAASAAAGEMGLGPASFAAAGGGLPPLPGVGAGVAGAFWQEGGALLGDAGTEEEDEEEGGEDEGSWLQLAGAGTGAEHLEAGLLLTSSQLQQVAEASEQADSARQQAVDSWLDGLALQRHQAERAAAAAALVRTATIKERQSEAAARQAQLAAGKHAAKADLLRQQSEEVAMSRARAAAQRTQKLAEERELLTQAALKEHTEAVEGLTAALAASSLRPTAAATAASAAASAVTAAAGEEGLVAKAEAPAGVEVAADAADAPFAKANAAGVREKPTSALAPAVLAGLAAQQFTSIPAAATAAAAGAAAEGWPNGRAECIPAEPAAAGAGGADAACAAAALETEPAAEHGYPFNASAEPGGSSAAGASEGQAVAAAAPTGTPRRPRRRWQHIEAALGSQAPKLLPGLAAFHSAEQLLLEGVQGEASKEGEAGAGERPAPLAAVLEMCIAQGVQSQYRAVSKACVRLFLDDLRLLEHLEALRRLFFMGAGDWAEALVSALAAHADSLEPLSQHALERLLQGAARGTSVEQDPSVSRLRVRLLPGLSIVNAQVQAVALPTPRRGHTRPRVSAASLVVPPNSLDGLDCIVLDYAMGWPLSAVITEDIMQGYAAVFSMLMRLKRLELLLRSLYAPLMMQHKSTTDVVLSEEEADRAYRRLQQLRGLRRGAAQLVAAVQAFLQSRISGEGWARLLAALMVSSERVAQQVLQQGPSAALMGTLSRMGSTAGSGSAAHRLLRLAKSLSRRGSFSSTPAISQPGTPSASAGATRVLEAAAAALAAAPGGPGPSRFAPGRSASAAAAAPASKPALVQQLPPGIRESSQGIGPLPEHPRQQQQQGEEHHLQQQQQHEGKGGEEGAIADLQELLNLHRAYIRGASADCLTLGGSPAAREAMDSTLQAALDWALRLQAAVRLGAAGRTEDAWVQVLRRDSTWGPLAEGMAAFDACLSDLHAVLRGAGSRGVLAELALQLDYNGYYARRQL